MSRDRGQSPGLPGRHERTEAASHIIGARPSRRISVFVVLSLLIALLLMALWPMSYWRFVYFSRVWHDTDPEFYRTRPLRHVVGKSNRLMVFSGYGSIAMRFDEDYYTLDPSKPRAARVRYGQRPIRFLGSFPVERGSKYFIGFWWWRDPARIFPPVDPDGEVITPSGFAMAVPHWFLALPFVVPPTLWFRLWRQQRHRASNGLCLKCGYDLRAHSPGQKCPECGTAVPEGHRLVVQNPPVCENGGK